MVRRSFLRALGLPALLLPAIAARAADTLSAERARWRSPLFRDHPLAGRIWDAAGARFIGYPALGRALAAAYFRLLGEVHDNPDHHAIQAELLDALGASELKPLVAFEQFDAEKDPPLQARLAQSNTTSDEVRAAVSFDASGWNWAFYRPLVEIALRHGMALRAANLSRAAAGRIAKAGLDALEPARLETLGLDKPWDAARESALREDIHEGHCGALPPAVVPRMAAAQRARDATLAEAMLAAGPDGAVLIAGNGHVRRDLGVPLYLAARAPGRSVRTLGLLEVEPERREPQQYLEGYAGGGARFDFVFFTPRWERPDPCAAFKARNP